MKSIISMATTLLIAAITACSGDSSDDATEASSLSRDGLVQDPDGGAPGADLGSVAKALTTCTPRSIYIFGGEAHYTECQSGETRSVVGWVIDRDADGKCAQVYGFDDSGSAFFSPKACGKGKSREFSWYSTPSFDFLVYLRTIG